MTRYQQKFGNYKKVGQVHYNCGEHSQENHRGKAHIELHGSAVDGCYCHIHHKDNTLFDDQENVCVNALKKAVDVV